MSSASSHIRRTRPCLLGQIQGDLKRDITVSEMRLDLSPHHGPRPIVAHMRGILFLEDPENPFEDEQKGEVIIDSRHRRITGRLQGTMNVDRSQCLLRIEGLLTAKMAAAKPAVGGFPVFFTVQASVAATLGRELVIVRMFFVLRCVPKWKHGVAVLEHGSSVCITWKERDEGVKILVVHAGFPSQEVLCDDVSTRGAPADMMDDHLDRDRKSLDLEDEACLAGLRRACDFLTY